MYISYISIKPRAKTYVMSLLLWNILALVLHYSKQCYLSTIEAITIFIYTLLPAVFLFIFFTHLSINLNLLKYLTFGIDKIISKIFGISKSSASVYIIGSIFGYPSGIKYASHLLETSCISKEEYSKLLLFTNNPSITYILSSVGIGMFGNIQTGILLFLTITLSNILIGICYRPKTHNNIIQQTGTMSNNFYKKKSSFLDCFFKSIKETFYSISLIFAFTIIFTVISEIICNVLALSSIGSTLVYGLLEISQGINMVSTLSLNISIKIVITSFILGFSSLMVIMQLFSVSYKHISFKFLIGAKLLQAILSSLICGLLLIFFR